MATAEQRKVIILSNAQVTSAREMVLPVSLLSRPLPHDPRSQTVPQVARFDCHTLKSRSDLGDGPERVLNRL